MQKIPCCDSHYGGRQIKIYRGPTYNQAGAGFFGDIFRQIVPLFTSRVLPYVGKRLYETGQEIAGDVKGGTSVRKAVKKGFKRALDRGKEDVLKKMRGEGKKKKKVVRTRKKKVACTKKKKCAQNKKKKRDYLSI